ncbi:hypothetical protein [Desulfobulbus sp.]|uniref:hypothetical protein n=1 Tax=Desulfobulbus sp. TaxID=895 RepID=UPI00286F4AF5|nr:hypothetical protein [Desulfobulbus sp.]
MSLLDQHSVFAAMLQDGPFAIGDTLLLAHPFSHETKQWVQGIRGNLLLKTKYRLVRNQVFDLLDVRNFDEILALVHDRRLRLKAAERAYLLIGNMFAIEGGQREVVRQLHEYARTADDVINSLRAKVLAPFSAHIETTNEIVTAWDPVELLLAQFDDRYHKKARFEAKRKLVLMGLAGSIDLRERETKIAEKFLGFLNFLNAFVWSPDYRIGELDIRYLHSRHHPDDFSCSSVKVLSEEEARKVVPGPGEKLTLIKRRRFRDNGTDIPIYVTIRKKEPPAKVLKLLRKNEKNPATAVDDELGLMAVLDSVNDVKRFVRHLTRSATVAKSFMTLEDISDTLTGGEYRSSATGSSGKTAMLKFFARTGGMRIEFILHTNRSYLNYIYQRNVAHDEYEVKRIFDTGVVAFLFPPDIYRLDLDAIRDLQLARFRRQIEEN